MEGVIYLDVLYMINFALDAFSLWATARFMSLKPRLWRIMLASCFGAMISIFIIILPFSKITIALISILIMLISLYILAPNRDFVFLLRALGVFLLIAFAMAGAALGGKTLLEDNAMQSSWKILFFPIIAAIGIAFYGMGKAIHKWQRENFCREITVIINNKTVKLQGLIDTGNDLCEPISKKPTVIAELASLSGLFPQTLFTLLQEFAELNPARVIEGCNNELWKRRFRLLPYNSIGGSGMLLGIKPDMVIIEGEEKLFTNEVIICFYGRKLAPDCGARAIVNPAVLTLPSVFERKRVC